MFRKLTLFIAALICSATAGAQWYNGLGARVSMDVSIPSGARQYYGNGAGFSVGLVYRMPYFQNFFFEPGLKYSYSTMSSKDNIQIGDYQYQGAAKISSLKIPMLLGYTFALPQQMDLSIATGPILQVNTSARQNILPNLSTPNPVPEQSINMFKHGFKRVQGLWGINLNFTFAHNYTVGIDTSVGISPLASFGVKDKKIKVHCNTVAVSLGYNF